MGIEEQARQRLFFIVAQKVNNKCIRVIQSLLKCIHSKARRELSIWKTLLWYQGKEHAHVSIQASIKAVKPCFSPTTALPSQARAISRVAAY